MIRCGTTKLTEPGESYEESARELAEQAAVRWYMEKDD